ncbi:hypothetical protein LCGC14_1609870 [marine sediment metagenome]|uniref:Uncharacterized protein n=1 Tax=marine sediment metagenome TaxID=412755 RepID=A0A0F9L8V3_9ZZZZ
MSERPPNCYICVSYNVCKGREEITICYIMFKDYWSSYNNNKWKHLESFLASKCKYYMQIDEDRLKEFEIKNLGVCDIEDR